MADWDDDGRLRKRHRLTDLTFDEISVVERGANQRAHIVLFKQDTEPPGKVTLWKLSDALLQLRQTYSDDWTPVAKVTPVPEPTWDDELMALVTPSPALPAAGYARAVSDGLGLDPAPYDRIYKADPTRESDGQVDDTQVAQLLGRHQRQAAALRESALADATVSLYRRLGLDDPDLAAAYDRAYGTAAA
jgi:hypothetical protein